MITNQEEHERLERNYADATARFERVAAAYSDYRTEFDPDGDYETQLAGFHARLLVDETIFSDSDLSAKDIYDEARNALSKADRELRACSCIVK